MARRNLELSIGPATETQYRNQAAQAAVETTSPPAEKLHGGYEASQFNALQHGVLSKHTVLPGEDRAEYELLLDAVVEEYAPDGPTEEHLTEEIAGVIWRKRRLRLAEAALYRRGLARTAEPYSHTLDTALIQLEGVAPTVDAVTATPSQTGQDLADLIKCKISAQRALEILNTAKAGAYETALAELDEFMRNSWQEKINQEVESEDEDDEDDDPDRDVEPYADDATGLAEYLEYTILPFYATRLRHLENRSLIRAQVVGEALDSWNREPLNRYEVHLDRKFERTLTMLLRLQERRKLKEPD